MEAPQNQNPENPFPFSSPEEQEEEEGLVMDVSELEEIQAIIGYKFNDPKLLQQAFTDSSYKEGCKSYERLEYIGDSVLNLLMAREHYCFYPDLPPGKLTRLRSANVDTEKLARVAMRWDLHKYLRHRKPLLSGQIEEFSKAIEDHPLHSAGLVDPPKALADIVESLIGAIFMDCNSSLETTWQVVKNLLQPMITPTTLETHPVTKLFEFCQKNAIKVDIVDSWKSRGEFEVFVDDEYVGRGEYKSKRMIALNRAAHDAYDKISNKLSPPAADS